jgi:NTP pyrophosphatase (non-canonical NTP hydrolase)
MRYSFDTYQKTAKTTAVYPLAFAHSITGAAYTVLGLVSEAGEVADQLKKCIRDDNSTWTISRRAKLYEELGDVLWYVAAIASEMDWDLSDVAHDNILKLLLRQQKGELHGR